MFKANEKSVDLTERLKTPSQRVPQTKTKMNCNGKCKLPAGWVVPDFLTAMCIGAEILIDESPHKPIIPSGEDIKKAFPRIAWTIIERYNTGNFSLPGVPSSFIRVTREFPDPDELRR